MGDSDNIPGCWFLEHRWLGELLEEELTEQQRARVIELLRNAKLMGVLDVRVSEPHNPCVLGYHGVRITQYTDVTDVLAMLQPLQGSCPQKCVQVVNYFFSIGRGDILNMQVTY